MEEARRTNAVPLVAAAVLLVLLAAYVAGYFVLTVEVYRDAPRFQTRGRSGYRLYAQPWMAGLFGPGAMVESALTGNDMRTGVYP